MADNGVPLLDDNPSATPLDLLLNAISGSGQYNLLTDDAPAAEEGEAHGDRETIAAYLQSDKGGKRPHEDDSPRQSKIARTLSSHFADSGEGDHGMSLARAVASGSRTFSTVEVWHPKTGQKSYGKERRLLQPPPTLRVTGPLLSALTNVSLSAHPNTDTNEGRVTFSSQSHRFALDSEEAHAEPNYYSARSKKDERDEKKRQMREAAYKTGWGNTLPWERNRDALRDRAELEDGVSFPGLWIGEESGKNKEFRLDLSVSQPGVEEQVHASAAVPEQLDEAALRNVLSAADMAPLMNLSEAEASTPMEGMEPKADGMIDPSLEKQPEQSTSEQPPAPASAPPPWATFTSDPLTIVSKPSQKTAKARSMASCLSNKDAFALYVRVNAQTVRTKYLKLDSEDAQPQLAARVGKWSPFRFEIVQRALPPRQDDKEQQQRARFKVDTEREASIITYGSIVRIVDVQSETKSDPMRLVRVDKNEVVVGADEGHPVSELQRVGLVRVIDGVDDLEGGGRWYLSAPGAVTGAGEVSITRARPGSKTSKSAAPAMPETLGGVDSADNGESSAPPRKRKKTKRHALARAAIEEEEQGSNSAGLAWNRAERREGEHVVSEGRGFTTRQATIETVNDYMCWVLTGVWCFSYSFFNGLGDAGSLPTASLDPVPRLLVDPVYRPEHNALNLTLSYFYVPDESGQSRPLSVYLGPLGPLKVTTWRSVAPKEKYYDPGALYPAVPYSGNPDDNAEIPEERRVYSNYPFSTTHAIAMVELPEMSEIVRVMRECAAGEGGEGGQEFAAPVQDTPASGAGAPAGGTATAPEGEVEHASENPNSNVDENQHHSTEDDWLGVMVPEGELTIQEALRNAGKANGEADMLHTEEGSKDEFSLEQLPEHLIDPDLHAESAPVDAAAAGDNTPSGDAVIAATIHDATAATTGVTTTTTKPPTITMHRQDRAPGPEGTVPLPLLLVRPDGVGHGIGWSVVATRLGSSSGVGAGSALDESGSGSGSGIAGRAGGQSDPSELGLCVVQTSARGQSLAW